jgi:hypothetical protein
MLGTIAKELVISLVAPWFELVVRIGANAGQKVKSSPTVKKCSRFFSVDIKKRIFFYV